MSRAIFLCTCIVGLCFGLFANSAIAVPVLDQDHVPSPDASVAVSISVERAQTFTVGVAGILDSIALNLFRGALTTTTESLTLQIRDTSGGVPGSTVLGSVVTTVGTLPTIVTQFTEFDFSSSNIGVAVGDVLAIGILTSHPHMFSPSWRGVTGGSSYTSGEMFVRIAGDMVPQSNGFDGLFQTYVEPSAVPEPGTLVIFGIGFAGLGFAHRKRTV